MLPLNSRLDRAAQLVIRARIFYDFWFYLEGENTRPAIFDTLNEFSEFFRFDPHAHLFTFVVHMAMLFEKKSQTINFWQLEKEVSKGQPEEFRKLVGSLLDEAAPIARKVAILRNNVFAHRSALHGYNDVFEIAAVTPIELRELSEIGLRIANCLLKAQGMSEQYFNPLPREYLERMIETLARGLASP